MDTFTAWQAVKADGILSYSLPGCKSYRGVLGYSLPGCKNEHGMFTFTAWLGLQVPELKLDLPSTAIGMDWRPIADSIGPATSGTGG